MGDGRWAMGRCAWGRFGQAINLNAFCRLMEMNLVVAMGSYLVKTTLGLPAAVVDTRRCLVRPS